MEKIKVLQSFNFYLTTHCFLFCFYAFSTTPMNPSSLATAASKRSISSTQLTDNITVSKSVNTNKKLNENKKPASRNLASCLENSISFSSQVSPQNEEESYLLSPSQIETTDFDFKKINEWVPREIATNEDGRDVLSKIADNGLQSFLTSDNFKNSRLGQLNEKVKEETKVELKINSSSKMEHKIIANLEPFQQIAKIGYNGFFGAELSYYSLKKIQSLRFIYKIFDKNIFYDNSMSLSQYQSRLGVQWNW